MGSKVIVFLGFFLAMVLLISSDVAARELTEISNTIDKSKEAEKTEDQEYPPPEYPQPYTPPVCTCCGEYGCGCCN